MKPLYTKKNGTSQRIAAVEVKMPATYPASRVSYGDGTVKDELDALNQKMSDGESIALSDFFTANSAITVSVGNIIKNGNHIAALLVCTGSANVSAAGRIVVGSILNPYRPSRRQIVSTFVNGTDNGQIYEPACIELNTDGSTVVNLGRKANQTVGSASYPWCTTQGLYFDYWL